MCCLPVTAGSSWGEEMAIFYRLPNVPCQELFISPHGLVCVCFGPACLYASCHKAHAISDLICRGKSYHQHSVFGVCVWVCECVCVGGLTADDWEGQDHRGSQSPQPDGPATSPLSLRNTHPGLFTLQFSRQLEHIDQNSM